MGPLQGVKVSGNTFGVNTRVSRCAIVSPTTTPVSLTANTFTDGRTVTVTKG
jgi:hypothetical protein